MDKKLRFILKMKYYKRRLKNYRLKDGEGDFFAFRTTARPCNCWCCRKQKFNRKQKHKQKISDILNEGSVAASECVDFSKDCLDGNSQISGC